MKRPGRDTWWQGCRTFSENKANGLICKPYSLYEDLSIKIKKTLMC